MNHVKSPTPECLKPRRASRRKLLPAILGLAAGLLAGGAGAAETNTSAAAPLRVGVSPIFPPMIFKQGKEIVGVEADLARALGAKLGRPVVFVEMDWKDQTEALLAGKTDIIMSSLSVTPARTAIMGFTKPYFKVGQMALVRRDDLSKYSMGLLVPPGTKVGVLKATTGDYLAQREFPKAKIKTYATGEEAAHALARDRVKMFISDSTLVWHLAGTHADDGLSVVPFMLSEEYLGWGVRRGNDELLTKANEFITSSTEDGSLVKIFRRWMAVQ